MEEVDTDCPLHGANPRCDDSCEEGCCTCQEAITLGQLAYGKGPGEFVGAELDAVLAYIKDELIVSSHRSIPDDILRHTCIMVEEAGEALRAAMDLTRPFGIPMDLKPQRHSLRREVEQTAAAAIRLLIRMDREDKGGADAVQADR